jgi:hypothetical protein
MFITQVPMLYIDAIFHTISTLFLHHKYTTTKNTDYSYPSSFDWVVKNTIGYDALFLATRFVKLKYTRTTWDLLHMLGPFPPLFELLNYKTSNLSSNLDYFDMPF